MTERLSFEPTAMLAGGKDPVTELAFLPRRSTTDEQRRQAVRHALAWMAAERVYIVEVEVAWTRREPTVLTVRGHAERLGERSIACEDSVVERDAEGRVLAPTLAEESLVLERELQDLYSEGLD